MHYVLRAYILNYYSRKEVILWIQKDIQFKTPTGVQ